VEKYCAEIEDGVVVRVIVCDGEQWAIDNLGGMWVCCGDSLVGVGWLCVGGEFYPPEPASTPGDFA
jgi:hypothetical protein